MSNKFSKRDFRVTHNNAEGQTHRKKSIPLSSFGSYADTFTNLIIINKFSEREISKSSCCVSMTILIFFIQQFHKQRNDIKLSEKNFFFQLYSILFN